MKNANVLQYNAGVVYLCFRKGFGVLLNSDGRVFVLKKLCVQLGLHVVLEQLALNAAGQLK